MCSPRIPFVISMKLLLDEGVTSRYILLIAPPMKLLYEGKAKRLYETEQSDELLMEFKDDATAFNGVKHAQFENKGRMNQAISLLLMQLLEKEGVPTHYVRTIDDIRTIVKSVEIIKVEVVVRNVAAGSLCSRTWFKEGEALKEPLVEWFLKDDALGDPMINDGHIYEMNLATPAELALIKAMALKINEILKPFFLKTGLTLIDFKLEFGRLSTDPSTILLADEISPDTCRLWDVSTGEKMDKDRFRRDLGNVMESYAEVLKRAQDAVNS